MTTYDETWTAKRDLECRSSECRHLRHSDCDGHYGTAGSSFGYDTFACFCACHRPAPVAVSEPPLDPMGSRP
jgi:hypothetical protein